MKIDRRKFISSSMLLTIVISVFVWLFGYLYILHDETSHKELYLEKQTENQQIAWEAVMQTHKVGMRAYFDSYIMKPEVLRLMRAANLPEGPTKTKAREELFRLLAPVYAKLEERNVRQLHFHDKNNNSFLRFHHPVKFGDSLNTTRPSVVVANRDKSGIQGFETGKVVSGFRNVFPIIANGEHLGSVELSQPFEAIKEGLHNLDSKKELLMLIRSSAVLPKIFDEQKKYYTESIFSDKWLMEDSGGKKSISDSSKQLCRIVKNSSEFNSKVEKGVAFSYEVNNKGKIFVITVTPIIDTENKYTAAVFSFAASPELERMRMDSNIHLISFTIMLFVASFALFRLLYSKKELDVERRRLSIIAETMGEGLYVIDINGRIKYINQAALDMLGLKREDAIGVVAHYLFHSHAENGNMSLAECPIYKTIASGKRYDGEDSFRRKNGELFFADIISSPLEEDGEIIGSVTTFKDMTERIKLEESLKNLNVELNARVEVEVSRRFESEAIFKAMFDKSPEGILISREDGVFIECNTAAAQMLGYTQEELVGKRAIDISPDIQPESGFFTVNAVKVFAQNAFAGATQHFEWTHIAKDGSFKLLEVMLSPIIRGDKKELLVIWRDITQLKELEREKDAQQALLIQQSKLAEMGSMIGAIAHQWKQPINAIWLMVQDLKMGYDYGELTPEFMDRFKTQMGEQVKFMSQTIEDFRNFYKPSKGASVFNIAEAIDSVVALLKNQLDKYDVSLILNLDKSLYVEGYESEFKQVVLNIVNNAQDAFSDSKAPKKISISAKMEVGHIAVRISDNAGGIDEKMIKDGRIFEPYSTTKGNEGTGIGLYLGKMIIEKKMHGKLWAQNIEDGAEFVMELAATGNI